MGCENPEYCELCGDCINCYAEDPCPYTEDGRHVGSFESVTKEEMNDMLKEIAEKSADIIVKQIVRCHNCEWMGFETELVEKTCPNCKNTVEHIKEGETHD